MTKKLTQELKDQWVAALRSSKYKQGKDVLKQGDEYCCLGVLGELTGHKGLYMSFLVDEEYQYTWVNSDYQDKLAELNDAQSASFSQIADYIESLTVEELSA